MTDGPMLSDHVRFNRIIFRDQVYTGSYLTAAVDDCARHLDATIRSNSPVVFLHAPNHLKTVIAFLAIVKSGRTCLLVDPLTGELEYAEMLADATPGAIIRIDPETIGFDFGREIAATDYRMDPALAAGLDDVCLMLYTAAEDGYPKAAMLTHENLLSSARTISEDNQVDDRSVSCALIPFDHIFGFQYGIVIPLCGRGSIVINDAINFSKMSLLAETLCRRSVTHLYSVPIVYHMLGKSPFSPKIGKNAGSMICGGYKLPLPMRKIIEERFSARIDEGYGLTETTAGCTWQREGDGSSGESVGKPVRNCRIRIVDDAGTEVPDEQVGEICVKGPQCAKGYFNQPSATEKSFADGWFHTGDLGRIGSDGSLFLQGLKKNMFNVAGNKVYAAELKRLMMKNPNIVSVDLHSEYQASVGDRVKAAIALKTHLNGEIDACRRWLCKSIRPQKLPSTISFIQD